MLGNLLLLSYFADKREPTATAAQAIGVTTSFMLITQIAWSGNVHNVAPIAMASASAFIVGGATLSVARYFNYAHGARGEKLWSMYQTALGVIGLTVTPQIISNALTPGLGWLPVELSVLGLVAAHRADKLPTKWSNAAVGRRRRSSCPCRWRRSRVICTVQRVYRAYPCSRASSSRVETRSCSLEPSSSRI